MKVRGEDGEAVLFLCDKKACDGGCLNDNCSHTSDICHAKNFDFVRINNKLGDYFEVESDLESLVRRVLAEEQKIA